MTPLQTEKIATWAKHAPEDLEIIALHHRVAELELQAAQSEQQRKMANGISNQLQAERAKIAQQLRAEFGLLLMPGKVIVPAMEVANHG